MAAGAGAGVPASAWLSAAWPRAGLLGVAVAVAGTGLLAGAGAGNAGKMNALVPMRESRLVGLCWSARRLAARSLVAAVVMLVILVMLVAEAAFVAAEALSLVAERTGGVCACVAVIGTSKRNRRALAVFTMMNELGRVVLLTVWSNLTWRIWLRLV